MFKRFLLTYILLTTAALAQSVTPGGGGGNGGSNLLPLNNTWTGTNDWFGTSTFHSTTTFPAGTAATNVGTLGGDLSGTLPNPTLGAQATKTIQITPTFCAYNQLTGTTPNDTCVQNAINYACSNANNPATTNAGILEFARGLYYIKFGVTIPKACSGLQLHGQGFGNPTSVNVNAGGTFIISDNNCTGPIINFYNDATQNYVYGGAISNIGFWNNILTGGSAFGTNSCLNPLIQINHAQVFYARDIYAWQPYAFLKVVGGLHISIEDFYGDQALQDSPAEFEFTGWGAHPDGTGQLTRQDQVELKHVFVFGNTAPQAGHKLPLGIWWHGFSASLKLFDTNMETVSTGLQVDCTTTGIAAAEIGACPAFGVFNDFEIEGAPGNGFNLVNVTDAQSLDFNFLYAACFAKTGSGLGLQNGCNNVVHVQNTTFTQTGTVTIRGGQLNGARADGVSYEGFNLSIHQTHIWGSNADANVGVSDIVLAAPVGGNASGSHNIIGNLFCVAPYGAAPNTENAVNSIAGNDYVIISGNIFRGCAAGIIGAVGAHGSITGANAGP